MSNYSRFFALYNRARRMPDWPYDDHRTLVSEFTHAATDSLRQLTAIELRRLENRLEELTANPAAASAQRMRRKIIAILAGRGVVNASGKPDMPRIYGWAAKYGYLHKHLNAYRYDELPRLVTQAEAIVASDLKAIASYHG